MTGFYPLEYLSVLKRWKIIFMVVFCSVVVVSALFASKWSKYRASATVEIAMPEIAMQSLRAGDNDVTAETIADLQISRLKQQVFSTSSLAEVIAKLNLYPGARRGTPITYIAKGMRGNIDMRLVGTTLANSATAQKASAQQLSAIAFVISFEYSDPVLAQKTVNEIVSKFLNEDIRERRETAEKTSQFLQGQIDILTKSLEDQEQKIAEFRSENGNIRADALNFNQQASISTSSRLMAIDSDITSIIGRIGALRGQLAQTEPYLEIINDDGEVVIPPSAQLRSLQSQYAALTARYGPEHPDVLKVKRQIDGLKRSGTRGRGGRQVSDADNPTYLQILAQIDAAEKQKQALETQKKQVQIKQDSFDQAIAANPEMEQKMASLARDYENMIALYRELKGKKLISDMNQTIEDGHAGRRLSVIDPAEVPLGTNPSKKIIFVAGVVFAFLSALGSIIILQFLSQSIIGPHHLKSIIGVTPLVKVPHMRTAEEINKSPYHKIMQAVHNFRNKRYKIETPQEDLGDFEKILDDNHIVSHKTYSREADTFRFLRTQILQKMTAGHYKTLAISSARYNDGKSTIASNLAVSIAQDLKQTVLLVDLDLRNPSLADYFGIETDKGLTDYLGKKAKVKDCLVKLPFERISVFPAGNPVAQSSETLGSPEMEKLAKELRERYDDRLIIYDLPPLLQQDDPLVFLPHVDAFMLVVNEGVTTDDEVKRCLDILEPANVLGVVLNDA